MSQTGDMPVLESWRVITDSGSGEAPASEATVRVRAGAHRVVVNGEGPGVAAALEAGVASAVRTLDRIGFQVTDDARGRLEQQARQCLPNRHVGTREELVVRAINGNALVTRLASVLGNHDVTSFGYDVDAEGVARVVVTVRGGAAQVERAAHRLRRVVGVLDVSGG